MIIVGAPGRSSGLLGPCLVLRVIGTRFASKTLGHHPRHVGLEGQCDQVHHQLKMLLHAVLALGLRAHSGLVELRATAFENSIPIIQSLLDLPNRFQVLVHSLPVDHTQPPLKGFHIVGGGVEDAAIQRDAGLGAFQLRGIGRRKEPLEDRAVVVGRRNIDAQLVAGKSGASHTGRPRQRQRRQIGWSDVLGRDLVK